MTTLCSVEWNASLESKLDKEGLSKTFPVKICEWILSKRIIVIFAQGHPWNTTAFLPLKIGNSTIYSRSWTNCDIAKEDLPNDWMFVQFGMQIIFLQERKGVEEWRMLKNN